MMPTPIHPFPGLRPFKTEEQYLFFGREGQSEEVIRRLRQRRFLALIGTSGSGKSSLIRAGLLPALYGGFMAGAGSRWRVATFRPGVDPIGRLALALTDPEVLNPDMQPGERERDAMLQEAILRGSGLGLIEAVKLARLPKGDNLLIIVDQLEELFRFEKAANTTRQEDDAAAFVKLLLEATAQTEFPIYVVVAIRSDFIGDCARFRKLPEAITSGLYLIPWMTREQQRLAIVAPVEVAGAAITSRLVTRLLSDAGDNPDQLPILQHALMRTWDHRQESALKTKCPLDSQNPLDLDDYLAVGGMEEALSRHANETYDELPSGRFQFVAKKMFKALTEKGADKRGVRRPVAVDLVAAIVDAAIPEVLTVAEHFRKAGFLVSYEALSTSNDEYPILDISHESLIYGWDKLRGWVEDEHESSRIYKRLADRAEEHAHEHALPLVDPELQRALDWEQLNQPNAVWAQRYDPNFDRAISFLRLSEAKAREAHDAEMREQIQEAEQRKAELKRVRKQVRVLAGVLTLAFFCACAAGYLWYLNLSEQKRANGEENDVLGFAVDTLSSLGKIMEQEENDVPSSTPGNGTNGQERSTAIDQEYGKIYRQAAEISAKILLDPAANPDARIEAGKLEAVGIAYSDHIGLASATSDAKKDELRKTCKEHLDAGEMDSLAGDAHDIVARILLTASSADVLYRLGDQDNSRQATSVALDRILLAFNRLKPGDQLDGAEWQSMAVSIGAIQGILEGRPVWAPSGDMLPKSNHLDADTGSAAHTGSKAGAAQAKRKTSRSEQNAHVSVIEGISDVSNIDDRDSDRSLKLLSIADTLASGMKGSVEDWNDRVLVNLEIAWAYASIARTGDRRKLSLEQRLSLMNASEKTFDRADAELKPVDSDERAASLKRLSLRFRAQMKASLAALHHDAARQNDLQAAIDLDSQALDLYGKVAPTLPSQLSLLTDLGKDYLLNGQTSRAEEIFQQVDASIPRVFPAGANDDALDAYVDIRDAYEDQYAFSAGTRAPDKIAHIRSERAWTEKAMAAFRLRRAAASNSELRASVVKSMARIYGALSWYDLLLGDFKNAEAEAQQAFALDNSQTWVMSNAAHGYLFQGHLDQALAIYRRYAAMPERPGRTRTFHEAVEEDFTLFRKEQYPGLNLALVQQAEDKLDGAW